MALFPQQFIDDLKLQANIVQVVQEYVPLKRAGTSYKGLCPFHSEKTPSFHVYDKGFFKCFGCDAGGDVFKFLELHEKVGFQDAVRMLAQKFGMTIPETVERSSEEDSGLREMMLKVHELAAAYFKEELAGPAGSRARQQLKDRDVTAQTVEQLGLGFAPQSRDGLKSRLLKQGFATAALVRSGLLSERDNGEIVDRFRNRLMVPICRETGSVIAFGGRVMDADQGGPKYLNSPETPIYSKGRTLYGLNLTKAAIRTLGYAVLVEGYFDFAQVFQSQAAPVVASCGTALTTQQAQLLRRFTTKIVLSYDPDAAGQGAAARSSELLVAEGFDVNVVVLDKGEDPDTFIRRQGPDRYRERLRGSRPYLRYLPRSGGGGARFRTRRASAAVPGKNAGRRCQDPGSGGPRSVWGPDRPSRPYYRRGDSRGNPEGGGWPADGGHDPGDAGRGSAETSGKRPDLGALSPDGRGTRRPGRARAGRPGISGGPGGLRIGPRSARSPQGRLTLGALAASKSNERSARHRNCRPDHPSDRG